jgi:precorrin-4 methylase
MATAVSIQTEQSQYFHYFTSYILLAVTQIDKIKTVLNENRSADEPCIITRKTGVQRLHNIKYQLFMEIN